MPSRPTTAPEPWCEASLYRDGMGFTPIRLPSFAAGGFRVDEDTWHAGEGDANLQNDYAFITVFNVGDEVLPYQFVVMVEVDDIAGLFVCEHFGDLMSLLQLWKVRPLD